MDLAPRSISSEQRLEALLRESVESVVDRENHELERRLGSLDDDFILFGAGNLGRKVLRTLQRAGKKPIAFIDNNPTLSGTSIEGVPVVTPRVFAQQRNPEGVGVIVTIWYGEATDTMADRLKPLRDLGFRKIALFGHLAWKFAAEFLPHYSLDRPSKVLAHAASIRAAFDLLADQESRELFVNHVAWRMYLDYDLLPPPSREEIYFNTKYINVSESEVLYDIGAYTGDSIDRFLSTERGRKFSEIHAFEPSPDNFSRLEQYSRSLNDVAGKIFVHRLALGDSEGVIRVEAGNGPSARVGRGHETVQMTTIDEFSRTTAAPTFIKIDIEGFEPSCLAGAKETIRRSAPAIAVCVYHLQSHVWDIALQLHSYYSNYSFSLCPHMPDGWDLVLYAVPKYRLPA